MSDPASWIGQIRASRAPFGLQGRFAGLWVGRGWPYLVEASLKLLLERSRVRFPGGTQRPCSLTSSKRYAVAGAAARRGARCRPGSALCSSEVVSTMAELKAPPTSTTRKDVRQEHSESSPGRVSSRLRMLPDGAWVTRSSRAVATLVHGQNPVRLSNTFSSFSSRCFCCFIKSGMSCMRSVVTGAPSAFRVPWRAQCRTLFRTIFLQIVSEGRISPIPLPCSGRVSFAIGLLCPALRVVVGPRGLVMKRNGRKSEPPLAGVLRRSRTV